MHFFSLSLPPVLRERVERNGTETDRREGEMRVFFFLNGMNVSGMPRRVRKKGGAQGGRREAEG